jgi:ketosteroid isomerase-like protein
MRHIHDRSRPTLRSVGIALLLLAAPAVAGAQRTARASTGRALQMETMPDTALASLVRAEAEFMRETEARRIDGWVAAFAEDAATFPPKASIQIGTTSIRTGMAPVFADSASHLVWHPVFAAVANSGELGYTYGYARWTRRDSTGRALPASDSKYVTIWRRDAAGRWKVAADLGNDAKVPDGFFEVR